ncbi:hypothetical protein EFE17_01390 [Pediococcus pentosaceus]|nr:hypothetical protein [Pediococcus pentosaceus]
MDVMTLPKLNEKATGNQVKDFFRREYPRIARLAGKNPTELKSTNIDDMPRAPQYGNHVEDNVIEFSNNQLEYLRVVNAIKGCSMISQQIILYDLIQGYNVGWVSAALKYSPQRYNDLKKYAMNEFADTYEFWSGEDLHVYF